MNRKANPFNKGLSRSFNSNINDKDNTVAATLDKYLEPYDQIYFLRNTIKKIQGIILDSKDPDKSIERIVTLLDDPDTVEMMSFRRYLDDK